MFSDNTQYLLGFPFRTNAISVATGSSYTRGTNAISVAIGSSYTCLGTNAISVAVGSSHSACLLLLCCRCRFSRFSFCFFCSGRLRVGLCVSG